MQFCLYSRGVRILPICTYVHVMGFMDAAAFPGILGDDSNTSFGIQDSFHMRRLGFWILLLYYFLCDSGFFLNVVWDPWMPLLSSLGFKEDSNPSPGIWILQIVIFDT